MAEHENSKLEIIWGNRLLDEGFTSIPNLLIRNYRNIGIEHGEYGFISVLLSYKHDARDPYPSRTTLAKNLNCSERMVNKWVENLKKKGLLKTGRRRNIVSKRWDNTVYNFGPLMNKLLEYVGEKPMPVSNDTFEIEWDDEPHVPEVPMGRGPEVPTKSTRSLKENIKKDDDNHESINLKIYEENKEKISVELFAKIVERTKENKRIKNYEAYLKKSVAVAIEETADKKEVAPSKEVKAPKQNRSNKKSIEIVQPDNDAPVPTEEELEEMIRFAEEMQNNRRQAN